MIFAARELWKPQRRVVTTALCLAAARPSAPFLPRAPDQRGASQARPSASFLLQPVLITRVDLFGEFPSWGGDSPN